MHKKGDRAPKTHHSSRSGVCWENLTDPSFPISPPFLFSNSGRSAVLHLREHVGVLQLLRDEASQTHSLAPSCTTWPYGAAGDTYRPCGGHRQLGLLLKMKRDPSSPGEAGSLSYLQLPAGWPSSSSSLPFCGLSGFIHGSSCPCWSPGCEGSEAKQRRAWGGGSPRHPRGRNGQPRPRRSLWAREGTGSRRDYHSRPRPAPPLSPHGR